MASQVAQGTWRLDSPRVGTKALGARWARLVIKGYNQHPGEDFDEVYVPASKSVAFRTMVAVAAHGDLELEHLDFKTAFMHGELDRELYMEQPLVFEDPSHPTAKCLPLKYIYGLKQAARALYLKLKDELQEYEDHGPLIDCVVRHNGDAWVAALDTTELITSASGSGRAGSGGGRPNGGGGGPTGSGALAEFLPMASFAAEWRHGTFSSLDSCNYALNVYDCWRDLDLLSLELMRPSTSAASCGF
eukprot:353056-Chlamydomonas_euryale.AAC.2